MRVTPMDAAKYPLSKIHALYWSARDRIIIAYLIVWISQYQRVQLTIEFQTLVRNGLYRVLIHPKRSVGYLAFNLKEREQVRILGRMLQVYFLYAMIRGIHALEQ